MKDNETSITLTIPENGLVGGKNTILYNEKYQGVFFFDETSLNG
jgi:hypothetical protein